MPVIKDKKMAIVFFCVFSSICILLAPSYYVAFAIEMPFPYVLFPPSKIWLYNENYTCHDQSKEIEKALEAKGIHVLGRSGEYNSGLYGIKRENGNYYYINDFDDKKDKPGHRWVRIDLGFIQFDFDSVNMMPISPTLHKEYDMVTTEEGFYQGKTRLNLHREKTMYNLN